MAEEKVYICTSSMSPLRFFSTEKQRTKANRKMRSLSLSQPLPRPSFLSDTRRGTEVEKKDCLRLLFVSSAFLQHQKSTNEGRVERCVLSASATFFIPRQHKKRN